MRRFCLAPNCTVYVGTESPDIEGPEINLPDDLTVDDPDR